MILFYEMIKNCAKIVKAWEFLAFCVKCFFVIGDFFEK